MKSELCGTYWYCVNGDGSRWLVKGDKPQKTPGKAFMCTNITMSWLNLDLIRDSTYIKDNKIIRSSDFCDVKFPERTFEEGPLEIEIVESGNVYWYDS